MINLAGDKEADVYIQEELISAGIDLVREKSKGEVPYSFQGRLGHWNFKRAWYYWNASAPDGQGFPLEIASELHEKRYPIVGKSQPETYGKVIRVVGHCGCPHPKEWAFPNRLELQSQLRKLDKENMNFGELAELYNNGTIIAQRFVNSYHIDSQEGMNEFARVIRKVGI